MKFQIALSEVHVNIPGKTFPVDNLGVLNIELHHLGKHHLYILRFDQNLQNMSHVSAEHKFITIDAVCRYLKGFLEDRAGSSRKTDNISIEEFKTQLLDLDKTLKLRQSISASTNIVLDGNITKFSILNTEKPDYRVVKKDVPTLRKPGLKLNKEKLWGDRYLGEFNDRLRNLLKSQS